MKKITLRHKTDRGIVIRLKRDDISKLPNADEFTHTTKSVWRKFKRS